MQNRISTPRLLLAGASLLALPAAAQAEAFANGSTLTVLGSNSEDVITVRFTQTPGEAIVFGVPGTPDGTTFLGIDTLIGRTFASSDIFIVESLTATPPELDIDAGNGDNQVQVDIQTPGGSPPAYSRALVRGGSGKDKVTFEVNSNSVSFHMDYEVHGGGADNDAVVKYSSDVLGGTAQLDWRFFGGAAVDKVLLDFACKPNLVAINSFGSTGDGADEWFIQVSGDANTTARVTSAVRLGNGNDKGRVDVSNCALTRLRGGLDGGAGNDVIEVLSTCSVAGAYLMVGGDGNDTILFNTQEDLLPGSLPRILAGNGDDVVSMLVSGAQLGSPFSDGGPGVDFFMGVGTAVNFEAFA